MGFKVHMRGHYMIKRDLRQCWLTRPLSVELSPLGGIVNRGSLYWMHQLNFELPLWKIVRWQVSSIFATPGLRRIVHNQARNLRIGTQRSVLAVLFIR
jgi:hypothetical protein